jgi:hypothetical protein
VEIIGNRCPKLKSLGADFLVVKKRKYSAENKYADFAVIPTYKACRGLSFLS